MKSIPISLFIISSLFFTKVSYAQNEDKLDFKIGHSLTFFYNTYGRAIVDRPEHKNKAYAFGFAIYINRTGSIDSVVFTNKTKELDSLVSFDNIVKELKKEKELFKQYKNTVLVSLAFVRRGWDKTIENVNVLDNSFYNVMPEIKLTDPSKKIILLHVVSLVQPKTPRLK